MLKYLKADIAVGALLVISAFTAGLFFTGYQDIHYAPAILALLTFSSIAVIPAFWKEFKVPSSITALLFFCLWLYVTISLAWSSVPFASLVTYLIFVCCPLLFFATLISSKRQSWLHIIGAALLGACTICALWAITQYVFLQDVFGPRAHHPLPNPNNLAGLINLGLLPACALLFYAKDKSWFFLFSLLLVLVFFTALLSTESRGGIIAALISLAVLLCLLKPAAPFFWQRFITLLVSAIIIFFTAGILNELKFAERLLDLTVLSTDSTAIARIAIWERAFEMLKDNFWLGTGFGTFYLYYASYRIGGADNSSGNWAHMDPLQYGIEMGITAPILLYALCAAVLLRTIKALKECPKDSKERIVISALFCALLAMMIHTHVTFHLYIMPILIISGAWLALWYEYTSKALSKPSYALVKITGWQKPFMAAVSLSIALLIGTMAVTSALGQHHLLRAHKLIKQGLAEQFVSAIEQAETWAPHSFIDSEVQLAAFYADLLGKNAAALFSDEEQAHLFEQTILMLDIAQSQNPAWGEIDYQRARLYADINTDLEPNARQMALDFYLSAIEKDKTHFKARHNLANLYIQRGHVEKAWLVLEEGLKYPHSKATREQYMQTMNSIKDLVSLKRAYDQKKVDE